MTTTAPAGIDLHGRNFLKELDYAPDEIRYLLDLAAALGDPGRRSPLRSAPAKVSEVRGEIAPPCGFASRRTKPVLDSDRDMAVPGPGHERGGSRISWRRRVLVVRVARRSE